MTRTQALRMAKANNLRRKVREYLAVRLSVNADKRAWQKATPREMAMAAHLIRKESA